MGNCWRSAAHGSDTRVYVWNVRRGALSSMLQGHTATIIGARFAHSGYLLATSSWDGTTRLWDGVSGEPLAMAPGSLRGSFAPDDRRLAFVVGGKVGVWDVAVAPECRTLHPGMLGNRSEARRSDRGLRGGCEPRRQAGGDLRWGRRPPLGGRHGTRTGPSQVRFLRDRAVSPRRPKPDQLEQVGLVSLADPARSRSRSGRNPHRSARAAAGIRGTEGGAKRPGCPIIGLWR